VSAAQRDGTILELPWLPEIPQHWEVARLKYVAKLGTGHTPSRQHPEYWEDCTIPWLTLADVWQIRDGRLKVVNETAEKISELGLANSAAVLYPAGTVFLSRTASVGFSGIMGVAMATSQDFMTWTCGPRLDAMFLLYVLRGMKQEFRRLVMGSTHKTIYMPDIERISIPLPPLDEQEEIVEFLDSELNQIDALADKLQRQAELLEERRNALIGHAIAGRLKR
jgi:type I restriction enzyme S subunit